MVISYLIGSVNPAILLPKILRKKDVRELGSGNAGATNVTRNFGQRLGLAVLLLDVAKGIVAIGLGKIIYMRLGLAANIHLDYLNLIAAILGHCLPVFFGFKGGKAVATTVGGLLILNRSILLMCFFVFVFVAAKTQQVGMGSVSAALVLPLGYAIWALLAGKFDIDFLFIIVISVIIIVAHAKNIKANVKFLFRGQ
jgi:glycerol-3-phosphate acyltransferase PlsY